MLPKVKRDTKRVGKKKKSKSIPRKKSFPKAKKLLTTLPGNLCGQFNYSRGESRICTDRRACRNAAPGPIWARRQSLAGMPSTVIRHE